MRSAPPYSQASRLRLALLQQLRLLVVPLTLAQVMHLQHAPVGDQLPCCAFAGVLQIRRSMMGHLRGTCRQSPSHNVRLARIYSNCLDMGS